MVLTKKIKCWFGFHRWTRGKGYKEAYCSNCKEWFYFENPEDSPQGRGEIR